MTAHAQEFDFSTPPFDRLTAEQSVALAKSIDIEFLPSGTRILEAGQGSPALYVLASRTDPAHSLVAGTWPSSFSC